MKCIARFVWFRFGLEQFMAEINALDSRHGEAPAGHHAEDWMLDRLEVHRGLLGLRYLVIAVFARIKL